MIEITHVVVLQDDLIVFNIIKKNKFVAIQMFLKNKK
jgi:hypothetical protein